MDRLIFRQLDIEIGGWIDIEIDKTNIATPIFAFHLQWLKY